MLGSTVLIPFIVGSLIPKEDQTSPARAKPIVSTLPLQDLGYISDA